MSPRATAYPPGGRRKQRPVQARGRNPRPVPVPSTDQPATTPTPDCHRILTFRKLMSLPRARGMRRPGHVEASMVTRDTAWPSGTPCWVDLGVDDIAKAGTFYAGLFGWEIPGGAARSLRLRHVPHQRSRRGRYRAETGAAGNARRPDHAPRPPRTRPTGPAA